MMMHTIGVPMRLKLAIRVLSLLYLFPNHKHRQLSVKITILFFIINIFNLTETTKRVSASYCSF